MERPNYRKGSIYFDDDTVLEVEQRGGGGAGVGGELGLKARNLLTGETTESIQALEHYRISFEMYLIEDYWYGERKPLIMVPLYGPQRGLAVLAFTTDPDGERSYAAGGGQIPFDGGAATTLKVLELSENGFNYNITFSGNYEDYFTITPTAQPDSFRITRKDFDPQTYPNNIFIYITIA